MSSPVVRGTVIGERTVVGVPSGGGSASTSSAPIVRGAVVMSPLYDPFVRGAVMIAPTSSGSGDGSLLGNAVALTDDSGRLISSSGVCAEYHGQKVHIVHEKSADLEPINEESSKDDSEVGRPAPRLPRGLHVPPRTPSPPLHEDQPPIAGTSDPYLLVS